MATTSTIPAANKNPQGPPATVVPTPNITTAPVPGQPHKPNYQPRDLQNVQAIIRDMGLEEQDPKVVNALLDFAYRYTTQLVEEGSFYSQCAGKKNIDIDDAKMATNCLGDKMFKGPPSREFMLETARSKNSIPLPPIKSHAGPRLPHDKNCLMAVNFKSKGTSVLNPTPKVDYRTSGINMNLGTKRKLDD